MFYEFKFEAGAGVVTTRDPCNIHAKIMAKIDNGVMNSRMNYVMTIGFVYQQNHMFSVY